MRGKSLAMQMPFSEEAGLGPPWLFAYERGLHSSAGNSVDNVHRFRPHLENCMPDTSMEATQAGTVKQVAAEKLGLGLRKKNLSVQKVWQNGSRMVIKGSLC